MVTSMLVQSSSPSRTGCARVSGEIHCLSKVAAISCAIAGRAAGQTTEWKVAMQTLNADGHGRTVALVRAILEQNSMSAAFDADTRFVELGLTSMDMVDLMLRVEAEFDITIPPCEITAENFVSVATLQVMIDRQLAAAIAA